MKKLGIYIHIPFCLRKCGYCDFCSFPNSSAETIQAYVTELCRRIVLCRSSLEGYEADTIYVGGGTPTLLSEGQMKEILDTLRGVLRVTDDCEITVECNPATANEEKLRAFRALGINRLSIGLQSANENELRTLGRAHSYADFEHIFSDARRAGFDNISADVMYGIPDQTLASYEHTLRMLVALNPEHISAYGLKLEEGTPFWRQRATLCLPAEEIECEMYHLTGALLSEYGYCRYEISNYAKSGRESRHNLRYWCGEEYLGLGVAAYSDFLGERFGMSRDLDAFLRGEDVCCEREHMSAQDRKNEYTMLGLRLSRGIDLLTYEARFGERLEEQKFDAIRRFLASGLLVMEKDRLALTEQGMLLSNAVLSELLDFS